MNCTNVERMLTAYLDGEVTAAERTGIETHLAGCLTCAGELADLRTLQRQVGITLHAVAATATPPPRAWARLQGRLAARPASSRRERLAIGLVLARPKPRLALVCLALVCALAVVITALYPGGLTALAQGGIERLVRIVYLLPEGTPASAPARPSSLSLMPVAEAQRQVDFHIYMPAYVPPGLSLVGVEVRTPDSVLIRYEGLGTIRRLDLKQTRMPDAQKPLFLLGLSEELPEGVTHTIVKGTIGGREALWVESSWPQSVALMLWERDKFAFTMMVSAQQPGLSVEEALRLAESLQ